MIVMAAITCIRRRLRLLSTPVAVSALAPCSGCPTRSSVGRAHAVVEIDDGVTEADLRDHLVNHLVPYKWPRSYELVSEQVRDDAGKVRKSALARRALEAESS
jgi:acyl-CoA synthetase (AMP-forming)/AMP-acid ligase II